MKRSDIELLNQGFELLRGGPDVLPLGFEILMMWKEEIRQDPQLYNKLIKHYRRVPSQTTKPNLAEIKTRHIKFAEELIGISFSPTVTSHRFNYITERLITYFKNNPDEKKQPGEESREVHPIG
jgi:hypothetical protein